MNANKILVVNCGSSSLKYEVYEMPSRVSLGSGSVERVGKSNSRIEQVSTNGRFVKEQEVPDHEAAVGIMGEALVSEPNGILGSLDA